MRSSSGHVARSRRAGLLAAAGLGLAAAALLLALPDASAQVPTGGPDLGGYTFIDSTRPAGPTPGFVDISSNGTTLAPPFGDDTETTLTLPFTFTWYGVSSSTIKVSSNGFLCLNPQTASDCIGCCSYSGTPGTANPNRFVAAYYGDLHCNNVPTCAYSHSWGTAPNRVFVVMVNGEECFPFPSGCNLKFEYKLFEGSNCIEVHYDTLTDPQARTRFAGTEGMSPGGTATGLSHFFATGPGNLANRAVRYCQTQAPPPECRPLAQTVDAGATVTLTAVGGTPPYSWSVTPSAGVTPATGTGSSFTATFTNPGLHTVTVTGGSSYSCTVRVVTPRCGYTVDADAPFDFVDLAARPTSTPLSLSDDSSAVVSLPFTFTFCDSEYGTVRVSSNGYVCLGSVVLFSCTDWTPVTLPSTTNPRPAVFGYYSDLFPPGCVGGSTACTRWEVIGTAPNRAFVYMQKATPYCCSGGGGPVSYQIKLFESTNCVEVHYLSVADTGSHPNVLGGYQDQDGRSYYTYAQTTPGFSRAGKAWSACPFVARPDAYVFNEDQAPQGFDVTANDIDGGLPTTMVSWTQPAKGTLVHGAGGNFTYQPGPDQVGPDSFQYTVRFGPVATLTTTVSIGINPVNDAPGFVGDDQAIRTTPEHGAQVVPGWGRQVRPGPGTAADESGQEIRFVITSNSNPALFAAPPTLERTGSATDPNGAIPPSVGDYAVLRFTPSGMSGHATVCFRPVDSGGTAVATNTWGVAAPGVDTGAEQCVGVVQNSPPVAFFEPSATTVGPGARVAFNDCPRPAPDCTHDADGTIVQHLWEFGDGATSSLQQPTHRFARPGTYTVRLAVWDDFGSTGTFVRTITVAWPGPGQVDGEAEGARPAPVADAGGDRTVVEGSPVTLAGAHHGGGLGTTFAWMQVGGPAVALAGADSAYPSFTAPALPGPDPVDLVFALRVTDGAAESAPDYATVQVVSANRAPAAAAGGMREATAGARVEVDGTASADPDGNLLSYRWEQTPLPGEPIVAIEDPTSPRLVFTAPAVPAVLHFRLTVSDGKATSVDQATVVVLAAAAPAPAEMARAGPADAPLAEARAARGHDVLPFLGLGMALLAAALVVAALLVRRLR
jgi:plastocyanin